MVYCHDIRLLADHVLAAFAKQNNQHAFTVAISGIDASGKGYISKQLQEELENRGYRVANINIDPWQNPLPIRLQENNPAENFYQNVFRWKDVFDQLIRPLKINKSICLQVNLIRTDADEYFSHTYRYENIDILLIDAILLLQEKFLSLYDYKVWIDCSFETGLQRAVSRNVEKLDEEKLKRDYETFYYAAQHLHFERDDPKSHADVIFNNDQPSRVI